MAEPRRQQPANGALGIVALAATAVVAVVGIAGVIFGVECGASAQCMGPAEQIAAIEPAEAAEPAPAKIADTLPEMELAIAAPVARAQKAESMISGTFDTVRSDDAGWLAGATETVPDEGDGAGPAAAAAVPDAQVATSAAPAPAQWRPTAAVAAIAAETDVDAPLGAPEPLTLSAYAPPSAAVETMPPVPQPRPEDAPVAAAVPVAEPATEPAEVASAPSSDSRTVGGAGVNVRSGPGKSNGKLFALAGGAEVKVLDNERGWLKVVDDDGRTGWVYKDYLN